MTPELKALLDSLQGHRTAMLRKVAGLSDADGRRSTVPSGTNLAGLLQHLTFVEAKWFEEVAAGRTPAGALRTMVVDPSVSLTSLRAAYKKAWATSDAIAAALGDAAVPVTYNGTRRDLRFVVLAAIGETARHAGHADIIREQIDGRVGR